MSDDRDFVERNGAFLLTAAGIFSGCGGAIIWYLLRSRCTKISCCGASCEREPLSVVEMEAVNNLRGTGRTDALSNSD